MTTTRMRKARPRQFKVWLAGQDCDRLFGSARRRGEQPEELLRRLIHVVLRDELLTAVLDEDERSDAPAVEDAAS